MLPRLTLAIALLFGSCNLFSQWTRVAQIPPTSIATLYHNGNTFYAGGEHVIYISKDNGLTWDSTSSIPQLFLVTSIIVFKNEIYAAAPNQGVYKSLDGGATWQYIPTGNDTLDVSDFCEFNGDLYASTFGTSIYKLNPVTRNGWLSFNSGLGNISSVATALAATSNTLIAGTLDNGLYDYLAPNSTTWEERFLLSHVSVNEGAFYMITAHDTLFMPGRTGLFYMSTDGGFTWNLFGNRIVTGNTSLANTKQALLASTYSFDGVNFINSFYYLKKDSLQQSFVNFDIVRNQFTWKIDILGDKLWDASDHGLFFMPLSSLPGISAVDDSSSATLPFRFTSFNASCQPDKIILNWKTVQEQNSSDFNIERSEDGISWTLIGTLPNLKNSTGEQEYTFTDNNPLGNSRYRIVENETDGRLQYSTVLQPTCNVTDLLKVWPNPVRNIALVNITASDKSQAVIKLLDSKGAMVKLEKQIVLKGNNQVSINMNYFANGLYLLSVTWNNGQKSKTVKLFKD